MTPHGSDLSQAASRKGLPLRTVQAVLWSFLGIRKSGEYEKDLTQLNPVHVVLVGLAAAALFVVGLVLLVRWVVGSGVAA